MPGTSGVLSPFGKIEGLFFNNSREPDEYEFDFKKDLRKLMEEDGVEYIEIQLDNKEDYYKLLDDLSNFNKESIRVSGTSKNVLNIIIEEEKKVGEVGDESE